MNNSLMPPFCTALRTVLHTMANMEASAGKIHIKASAQASGQVSGIIRLKSNGVTGSMAISFSEPLILAIFEQMLGERANGIDAQIHDLAGEITNMVTGAAKPALVDLGIDLDLTRPTTVAGPKHDIVHALEAPVLWQEILAPAGSACIELCFPDT